MRERVFGWSYPPGCSGPPDYDGPCDVCGQNFDNCICPECPICEVYGDPDCYKTHGLEFSKRQRMSLEYSTLIEMEEYLRMEKAFSNDEMWPW